MDRDIDQLKRGIVTALKAERWDDALPLLELWCERFPDHAKSWLNRGYCLARLERFNEAVAALDRCLVLDPDSTSAAGWRRRALAELDQAHTVSHEPRVDPAVTAAAQPAVHDVTRRAAAESQAPKSFATMAIPDTRRGWQEGTVIDGRYEVRDTARGGMAVVAIAFDLELRRMVAIKTPLPSVLASTDGRARFQREAESWVALGVHPNICSAYYLQEIGGMPRLFIEFVDGGDLSEWLKQKNESGFDEKLDIAIQIASGLDYTHNFPWTDDDGVEHRGLVHRDIKPANVLMTADGIARVTDFGLVRSQTAEAEGELDVREQLEPQLPKAARQEDSVATGTWQTVTAAGGLVGTPPYMAPELWRQAQRGTVASDVYAYGCLLYEVLCGRRPFVMSADSISGTRASHLGGWMRMHVRDEPPDPRTLGAEVDSRLAELMVACLAKDASARPASFAEIRTTLVQSYEDLAGRSYPRPEPRRTQLLADSLNNRGVSYVTLGLVERAAASFREAIDIDPRHLEATFNSGLLEWRREGLTDAEFDRRLSESEAATGNFERAQLLRSRLRLLLDDPEKALSALDALPAVEARKLPARREKGFALLAARRAAKGGGDLGELSELMGEVAEGSPSDLPAMVGLAEVCSLLGDEATAAEALTAARSLDRNLADNLDDAVASHLPGHAVSRTMPHGSPVQVLQSAGYGRVVVRTLGGEAVVWGPDGDLPMLRFSLAGPARPGRSIAVAGETLVTCNENAPLTLFDLKTGQRIRSLRTHPGVAVCVALSPDMTAAASGGSDRSLRLWNLETGECERSLQGHEAFISAVAWHPTRPWVVTAGADGKVRLWNLEQERCTSVFEGHRGPIRDLALSEEGRLAVSAGQDGSVGIWDVEFESKIRFVRGHQGAVTKVVVIGDSVVAGGEDGTLRFWSIDQGEALRVIRLGSPIHDLVIGPDSSSLLIACGSTVTEVPVPQVISSKLPWVLAETAASGELAGREQEFQGHLARARGHIEADRMEDAVAPLQDARAVHGYELHQEALDLWSTVLGYFPKREPRTIVELRRLGSEQRIVNACVLTADGAASLGGCADGTLCRFDCDSGDEVFAVEAHESAVEAIALSSDGELVATAGQDGMVRIWSVATGRRLHDFEDSRDAVRAVVFAPGDQAVIAAGDDGDVRIWRLAETAHPEILGTSEEAVSALAVSADGRFLVGAGWNNLVTVWSLRRRAELHRLEGHDEAIRAVAASPDCRLIASAGDDRTIRLWDLEGGRLWRKLEGHEDAVQAVAFTPDGRFLLSGGKDATVHVWDVRTARRAKVVQGHAGAVADIAIGREGALAVTAGSDSTVRLWFLDWEPEIPERGRWDDRVQPFLKVFLRQRAVASAAGGIPEWSEHDLRQLLEDLGRRGFGWLAPERVERELEGLVQRHEESRAEEQERTREQAKKRMRQIRFKPLKEIGAWFSENLGLKVAGLAAAVIVILLALWSLTSPDGGVEFSRLHRQTALQVQSRGMRFDEGTVVAYQRAPSVGTDNCGEGLFAELLDLTLNAERFNSPPLDPGVAADDGFRVKYANAVNCVGKLGTSTLTEQILGRIAFGLHPKRAEDLLGVLIRIDAAVSPQLGLALTDASDAVRHAAALTLVYSEEPNAIPQLLSALNGEDRAGVEAASFVLTELICLGAIDEADALETVRKFCQNIDPGTRRNATRALVLFKDTKPVLEVLDAALDDSDPGVVEAARGVRDAMENAL